MNLKHLFDDIENNINAYADKMTNNKDGTIHVKSNAFNKYTYYCYETRNRLTNYTGAS